MKKRSSLGRVYDLQSLFDRLNRIYFDSQLEIEVAWSNRSPSKAKSNVLLGSYCHQSKRIRISKRLDNPRVPLFFLEHVLFHEMLHGVFPAEAHRMHTPKFKQFEKMHPDYERARDWEKKNLKILFEAAQSDLFRKPFIETNPR